MVTVAAFDGLQGGVNFQQERWFIYAKCTNVPQTHVCFPPAFIFSPFLLLHLSSPQRLGLLFGYPKSAFPKLETHSEEVPDSPELECRPFPQETWSVSNQGALDRRVHTHTHAAAQGCTYNT